MGVIQYLGVKLLNKFTNDTRHNTSSSTSHLPTKESATLIVTPNGHLESEDSHMKMKHMITRVEVPMNSKMEMKTMTQV